MNGVTVLSTVHSYMPGFKSSAFFVLIVSCLLLPILITTILEGGFKNPLIIATAICLVVCIVAGSLVRFIDNEQYVYAIIEPDTSINDVLNKYEIISIDGELYKLKLIEKEEG